MKTFSDFYKICLLATMLIAGAARAQVGLSVALPDKSASLDLTSDIKNGLLLPRVKLQSLTDSTTIATGHPAKGLLLYNTAKALTPADSAGFYAWSGANWLMFRGDNLGNHTAIQGLGMNGNSISNDGTNTKGLILDDTGNAFYQQRLTVKSFGVANNSDNLLSANAAGLAETTVTDNGTIVTVANLARKAPLVTPRIQPLDSADVTAANTRTTTYMVVVAIGNACGRTGLGVFMVNNNTISFVGGQGRAAKYGITTVPGYNGSRLKLDVIGNLTVCADGLNPGFNQFGFTIMVLPGNVIRIINSGSGEGEVYSVTVTET